MPDDSEEPATEETPQMAPTEVTEEVQSEEETWEDKEEGIQKHLQYMLDSCTISLFKEHPQLSCN